MRLMQLRGLHGQRLGPAAPRASLLAHPLMLDRRIWEPECPMAFDAKYQDLGRRIVRAARLAAAVHLYESAGLSDCRRRVAIGGAGPYLVTDDERRRVEPFAGDKDEG